MLYGEVICPCSHLVSYQRYLCDIAGQARTCPKQFSSVPSREIVMLPNSTLNVASLTTHWTLGTPSIYFSKVVPTLNNLCPTLHGYSYSAGQFTLFDPPLVKANEVESPISKLKSSSSPGLGVVPPPLLKDCASAITLPLANLYNYTLSQALIPQV